MSRISLLSAFSTRSIKMASRGFLRPMSCFTLSISLLLLLILALSSYQATATSSSTSAAESKSVGTISETRRSMISWPDIGKFLNKIRRRIIDEMLQMLGFPPTGTIYYYFMKAVKWLGNKLSWFISNPRARIDTVIDWIVDSVMNPFRTLTDGMLSFRRLFRYLHRLNKGSVGDFGPDNPVYKCYKEIFPACVKTNNPSEEGLISTYFFCSWIFYERCQLRFWWENGKWNVPRINGGDPCKVIPLKKCADQPPI